MKHPSQDSLNCFEGLDLFSFVLPMSGLKSFVIFDIWGRRGGIKKYPNLYLDFLFSNEAVKCTFRHWTGSAVQPHLLFP